MASLAPQRERSAKLKALVWAWSLLTLMGALWGLSFSLARIVALTGANPLGIAFWVCTIAGALLMCMMVYRRVPLQLTTSFTGLYFITGLIGMVIPEAVFFYAAAHVPAGVLSITVGIVPILTFVASAFIGLEKFVMGRVFGVVLGAVAVVLLVAPEGSLPDPSQLPWVLLGFVSAVSYTLLGLVLALKAPPGANPFMMTCGMFLAASLLLVPLLYFSGGFVPFFWPWGIVEWSLLGMGTANAVAFTLFYTLVERAGPVFTSFTANVVTLFGVIWGIVIFSEQNSIWVWLSFATIMTALVLVAPRGRATSEQESGETN